ncbi:MAG: PrgI family protein [Candidatus Dormibacteria bacterium]
MSQAQVPQPISSIPARWGAFTGPQLAWLAAGALPGYVVLRLGLPLWAAVLLAVPVLGTAAALAFGRREGRPLDAWAGDWLAYQGQPHELVHPAAAPSQGWRDVPRERVPAPAPSLPWSPP